MNDALEAILSSYLNWSTARMTSVGRTLWPNRAHSAIPAQPMESGGTKEDSPANTQQSARREPISSQTEWLASGTSCLRRSSNQSPSTSSNPDMTHSRLPQTRSRRPTLRINPPLNTILTNYLNSLLLH